MKIGYARVSTKDQTTEQQEEALREAGCDRIYIETASGARADRPELAKMLDHARDGDIIVIWKLDRLARSVSHLITLSENLKARGICLQTLTDDINTTTASARILVHRFASLAEFERNLIRERIAAGIERAKKNGKVGGRPKTDAEKIRRALAMIKGGMSKSEAARAAGTSRATLYRALSVSEAKEKGDFETNNFGHSFETETIEN